MIETRYNVRIPFGFYGLCVSVKGITKEQVEEIFWSQAKQGIFPDEDSWKLLEEEIFVEAEKP